MALGIRILSENLSGQTVNVTYLPSSGGTIDLGTQVIPFNYLSSYYFGLYEVYSPTYGYTYTLEVPGPSPSPTPTLTSTPSPTPTLTSTSTPTPSVTTTNTPTQTQTPTQTHTPTTTQPIRTAFSVYSGTSIIQSCSEVNTPVTVYGNNSVWGDVTAVLNVSTGPATIDMTGFYNFGGISIQVNSTGQFVSASLCVTQTPTQTVTNTLTPTPTPTIP